MEYISKIISSLTGLEVWIFPLNGKPSCRPPRNTARSSISDEMFITFISKLNHKEDDPALVYHDQDGLSYIHGRFIEGSIVCGPFFQKGLKSPENTATNTSLRLLVPELDEMEIQAVGQLIRLAANQKGESVISRILLSENGINHSKAIKDTNRLNRETIDISYDMERKIRSLTATGNIDEMKMFLKTFSPTETMIHRIPNNPLREKKNGIATLNTILRLSAEKGGLLPVHLHGVSAFYANNIESAKSLEELEELRIEMCLTYCDAVHKFSLANHSFIVRKTAEYILMHLNEKLSLSDLAELVSCSPPYLARQFRKEYDMSVGDFIRYKKIEEAKYLLVNTRNSITEISSKLGFEDMGYFTRVFRKTVGKPPRAFRDHMVAEHDESLPIEMLV